MNAFVHGEHTATLPCVSVAWPEIGHTISELNQELRLPGLHSDSSIEVCSYSKLPTDVQAVNFVDHVQRCTGEFPVEGPALELLCSMLSLDPAQRPSAAECLKHPYFSSDPPQMTSNDFRELTRDLPQSHDYTVKKDRKRGRTR